MAGRPVLSEASSAGDALKSGGSVLSRSVIAGGVLACDSSLMSSAYQVLPVVKIRMRNDVGWPQCRRRVKPRLLVDVVSVAVLVPG